MSTLSCQNCHSKPPFTGSVYCSRTCAGLNGSAAQDLARRTEQVASRPLCQVHGCTKEAYCDSSGVYSKACSRSHRDLLTPSTAAVHHVATKCLLPSCTNAQAPGFPACSRQHIDELSLLQYVPTKLPVIQKACAASLTSQPKISPEVVEAHSTHSSSIDFYQAATNPTTSFLGNFHITSIPIMFRGLPFKCAEGAYQYSKLLVSQTFLQYSPATQSAIAQLFQEADGHEAWVLTNKNSNIIPLIDPAAHKLGGANVVMMEEILRDKFQLGSEERKLLQATGDKPLRECTGGKDTYWGLDSAGNGQNKLGQLLMQIRDETKSSAAPTQTAPTSSWGAWAKSFFE